MSETSLKTTKLVNHCHSLALVMHYGIFCKQAQCVCSSACSEVEKVYIPYSTLLSAYAYIFIGRK